MMRGHEILDAHLHLGGVDSIGHLVDICDHVGISKANIACTIGRTDVNANPAAFAAKAENPNRFYVFAGLDHSEYFSGAKLRTPSLAEQVESLMAIGADGIKMIEGKPTARKALDIPLNSDYYEPMFSAAESKGFPLLWHVADPEEFWDPERTPSWAKERGWGYDSSFVAKDALYDEVRDVLERHPGLKVIFAHFFFLSADLRRAAELLERFEGVHLDLAPGIELLYNLSRDPRDARDFFCQYRDRIVFGTDIYTGLTKEQAAHRASIVVRWLGTGDEYRVPEGADDLLGPPEDGVIRGLSLPPEVLDLIYHGNFERLVGPAPRPLNKGLAAEECRRIAEEVAWFKDEIASNTEAWKAANRIEEGAV